MERPILDYIEEILGSTISNHITGYQAQALDAIAELLSVCDYDHLCELVRAERDGRLVVLHSPRLPLIWGDDNHDTILCPNCKHDLMGGFLMEGSYETHMYQCPYCGKLIDETKALTREEAEAALEEEEHNG